MAGSSSAQRLLRSRVVAAWAWASCSARLARPLSTSVTPTWGLASSPCGYSSTRLAARARGDSLGSSSSPPTRQSRRRPTLTGTRITTRSVARSLGHALVTPSSSARTPTRASAAVASMAAVTTLAPVALAHTGWCTSTSLAGACAPSSRRTRSLRSRRSSGRSTTARGNTLARR